MEGDGDRGGRRKEEPGTGAFPSSARLRSAARDAPGEQGRGPSMEWDIEMEATAATAFVISCSWDYKMAPKWRILHLDPLDCSVHTVLTGAIVLMYEDSLAELYTKNVFHCTWYT